MKNAFIFVFTILVAACGHSADTVLHAKGMDTSIPIPADKWKSHRNKAAPIPAKTDLSPLVSLPENQGSCGSCWDFSLTKALRSEYMLAKKDPGVLEFNYLLNNCGPGPDMYGCSGGSFAAADSLKDNAGPGLNAINPYTQQQGGGCAGLPVSATAIDYTMLGTNGVNPSFKTLAYAVGIDKHMLSIDVAAGAGNWESYRAGIYGANGECSGNENYIDHMINLVGYDCESSVDKDGNCDFDNDGVPVNKDGYLIVENNWGENWGTQAANGHGGYMKIRLYDKSLNHCNAIATHALYFTLKQDK